MGSQALTAGVATCKFTYPDTSGSPHDITAVYNGDSTFAASTSAPLVEQVGAPADSTRLRELQISATPIIAQGWAQAERKGLSERASADAMIALAFIHHIAIGRNVPLEMAVDWMMGMAPAGVIEFPSKSDPMVQKLLAQREDIFPGYTEEAFLHFVEARGRLVARKRLSKGGRLLVWYDRSR